VIEGVRGMRIELDDSHPPILIRPRWAAGRFKELNRPAARSKLTLDRLR